MSRSALVTDGVPVFLAALVLALVLTLIAVIRLPRWTDTPAGEDEQPELEQSVSAWPAPGRAVPDRAVPDRAVSAWAAADRAVPDRAVPNWAAADRAVPDRAAADRLAPGRARTPTASGRARAAHAKHGHGRIGSAGVRPPSQQEAATSALSVAGSPGSRSGQADFTSRGPGGTVPWRGTVRAPKVSGSPPWEPAPRPPG